MTKKVVVVDSDTLIFRAAAKTERKSVLVKSLKSGRTKEYATRTEFKDEMKAKGYTIKPETISYTDQQFPEPLKNTCQVIKTKTESILDRFSDSKVIFCAGDKNNFRLDLPLPSRYKSNRDKTLKPINLPEARDYFIKKYKAIVADGHECDDQVSILAYEYLSKGWDVTVASPDKDCNSFDGIALWDYTNPEDAVVNVQSLHPILLNSKREFKSYGIPWLCYQWINGDSSDGFSPKALAGIKLGDVGIYELFKDCKTEKDYLQKTVDWYEMNFKEVTTFKDWTGSTQNMLWWEVMQLYYKCCRMKRSEDDPLCLSSLICQYGVRV